MDMTIVFIWKHTSGSRDEEGAGARTEQKEGNVDRWSSRKERGEGFIQSGGERRRGVRQGDEDGGGREWEGWGRQVREWKR